MKRFVFLALLGVMACHESTAPDTSLLGTYNLQTIGGKALPQSGWASGSIELQVLSAPYTPGPHYIVRYNGLAMDSGKWSQNGHTLTLSSDGTRNWTASINGTTITLSINDATMSVQGMAFSR